MTTINLSVPGEGFFADEVTAATAVLEQEFLPAYLPTARWFGGKARVVTAYRVEEILTFALEEEETAQVLLVRVEYESGPGETYSLPVRVSHGSGEALAAFADGALLADALGDDRFRAALLGLMASGGTIEAGESGGGTLRGERGRGLPEAAESLPSRVLKVEQSNSSLLYGAEIFMKLFRKLEDGLNPDVEISRFLNAQGFPQVPPYAGALFLERAGREPQVLALALGMVANRGDAWAQTLFEVRDFYQRLLGNGASAEGLAEPGLFEAAPPAPALLAAVGDFVQRVRLLGVRTGETHLALAREAAEPDFAPEPFTREDQRVLAEEVRHSAERLFAALRKSADPLALALLERQAEVAQLAGEIAAREVRTAKTRTHGDYHLGQVLDTGEDFILIDFEGEPQRSLAERKKKRSPLRDVAGMLRSFHYAAHSGLGDLPEESRAQLAPWAELWAGLMSRTFFRSWLETCQGAVFLPTSPGEVELLLKSFLLEKAIYEVEYELNNRPAWVGIPLRGILKILG